MMASWKTEPLGELCGIRIGGTPARANPLYWDTAKTGNNLWASIKDLRNRTVDDTEERLSDAGVRHSNAKLIRKGTLLLSFKLTIGRVAFAGKDLYTNEAIAALETDRLDPTFLYYALQHWDLLAGVDQAIKGATLNKKKLAAIQAHYPVSRPEQCKIAEVFSTIDQVIDGTEALIAKHQRIKTGLMQDLLTRGIDKHGNLRSPKTHKFKPSPLGPIPVEWDPILVEQAGDVKLGRQRSPAHQNGPYLTPYLRVANVFDGWIDYSDVLEMNFTPAERVTYGLLPGDILLNEGQSLELVGRSSIFRGPVNTFCFQNTLVRFRCNDTTTPEFCQAVFKFYLDTARFQLVAKQTTSVAHLGADRFAKMPFARPKREEQERIAEPLIAQDKLIASQLDHLAKLRRLKTGLMQDLLTGKVPIDPLL